MRAGAPAALHALAQQRRADRAAAVDGADADREQLALVAHHPAEREADAAHAVEAGEVALEQPRQQAEAAGQRQQVGEVGAAPRVVEAALVQAGEAAEVERADRLDAEAAASFEREHSIRPRLPGHAPARPEEPADEHPGPSGIAGAASGRAAAFRRRPAAAPRSSRPSARRARPPRRRRAPGAAPRAAARAPLPTRQSGPGGSAGRGLLPACAPRARPAGAGRRSKVWT